jgi:hypothetical protein
MGSSGNPYGTPSPVKAPEYINNPGGYMAYDRSGLAQGAIAQGNQAGANQIAQAKAQAAGMGGGRSSSVQNAVGGIESGLGQNAQNIFNQNAAQSFQQQLAQMQNQNQYNLTNQGNQNAAYGNQANAQNAASANNTAQNGQLIQGLMTAAMIAAML